MKKEIYQEQIIRKVTGIGNGAHVFAPKEWMNEEVILVRVPKEAIRERVLDSLSPHLKDIVAVFLYGSHVRNEQEEGSDIDLFVISGKKLEMNSKGKLDIIVVQEDKINKAIETNPILFYSLLREAKPIINSSFLAKLQKQKINPSYFNKFIEDTESMIRMNREFIDLDRLDGEVLKSDSVIYSLILRLRGVFLIRSLITKGEYSNKLFKKWIEKNIERIEYEKIYNIYRAVRDKKEIKEKIDIKQAEELTSLLEKEILKLKKEIKK